MSAGPTSGSPTSGGPTSGGVMSGRRWPVVELRQYTLRSGHRDALVDLFDRALVESQEACGMAILGQFRDLDDPDRFVWLRGFPTMSGRAARLHAFYRGPVWRAHSVAANATMVAVDDVHLLRPVAARYGFPVPAARPPIGHTTPPSSLVLATMYHREVPFDDAFTAFFDQEMRPVLVEAGAAPLAGLHTEPAENDFPALPVRTGEQVFVWFTRLASPAHLVEVQHHLAHSPRWRDRVLPALSATLSRPPHQLRLAPTPRSSLR